jgi:ABC-2 type transport system ATP-binding protein
MSDETTVIRLRGVSKRFVIRKDKSLKERLVNFGRSRIHRDDFWALRDVDLDIAAGSTVGLIGPNGSGKSTLLKAIGGIIQPTAGTVERRGRLAALLELGAGFHPDLTGRENVYLNASILGLSRRQTEAYFDAIVDFSGIERFIDTQVKFYSSGMYVRLAFAVAVHVDPDLLLIDEVLAVGDEPFQRKCMDRIRTFQREGRTIVLVSHALDQVAELCDHAVVLEQGRVVVDGSPREALRTLRADYEIARQEAQERAQETLPTSRARVVSIEVLDRAGTPREVIQPKDDVVLAMTVEAEDELRDWMLGVGIETTLGHAVWGTNSKLLGVPMAALHGRGRYEILLPDLALGDGQYHIHGAIAEWVGPEIHRLPSAATLTVKGVNRGVGDVDIDAQLRLPRT